MPHIAIIGMSVRVPGAEDPLAFWRSLRDGTDAITHFAPEELHPHVLGTSEARGASYVRARGILPDVEEFDAALFDFTPREAQLTDPQHRLLMECAWEAFERAGYNPRGYPGPVGLFAGAGVNSYLLFNLLPAGQLAGTAGAFQAFLHNKHDHLATRIAYKLGLRGPAITVQTACSTSLVAVALACNALATWQCDAALAGGANVFVPQASGYLYHDGGIGSPDGRCRPFDAAAAGTVPGNGAGMVLLKRLEDALRDGDTIQAVIRGWSVNNDGARRVGYTAPGTEGQLDVVVAAQELAEVAPDTIGYVEAHGTATLLGDPIEFDALRRAFRRSTARSGFCAIGSVKGNIGHLDAAAGVAGLIKAALALKHREIPPSAHFTEANPRCDFGGSPFYVADSLRPWPASDTPRRAAVSSFGLGGTNAHVVLEEAPSSAPASASRPHQLLVLSGQTAAALEASTARMVTYLAEHPELDLGDVAWTLQVGRTGHERRRVVVARDAGEAARLLKALDPATVATRTQPVVRRQPIFMFPGEGTQYPGMGRGLYATEPAFRAALDLGLAALPASLAADVRALLVAEPDDESAAAALLRPEVAQPALFVVEYALATLWASFGVRPAAVVGYGIGELAAACVAGVLTPEDGARLAAARGRLLGGLPDGAMLDLSLSERRLRAMLPTGLTIAAVFGAESCTVAGASAAVAAFGMELRAEGIAVRQLAVNRAYNSPAVESAAAAWLEEIGGVVLRAPTIPVMSTLTGEWVDGRDISAATYWVRQLSEPVRFHDSASRLLEDPATAFLEVGPGRTLRSLVRWHPSKRPSHVAQSSLGRAGERGEDRPRLLQSLGALWLAGVEPDWTGVHNGDQRRRVELPTYPFQRTRHWIDAPAPAGTPAGDSGRVRGELADWFWVQSWREAPATATSHPPAVSAAVMSSETWLVFASAAPTARALVDRVRASGASVVVVEAGSSWRAVSPDQFEIDVSDEADYRRLLSELAAAGRQPSRVVHTWSMDATPEDSVERAFFSLVYLARALTHVDRAPVTLTVVTAGMHDFGDDEPGVAEQATVLGPVRVIPREYPHVTARSVDLPLRINGVGDLARVVDLCLAECLASAGSAGTVAVRGARRWLPHLAPRPLPATPTASPPLRAGGTYLVTGGLGGIGLTVAGWIARTAPGAHVVLTGRSSFPSSDQWDGWLVAHGATDANSRRIVELRRIESLGATVTVEQVDVADEVAMTALVARTIAQRGALHGVVHAAGVAGGGLLASRSREAMLAVLEPKVRGAAVLSRLLAGVELDFLVFCGSRTAVGGRAGQVDYVSANAFLDVFAAHLRRGTGAQVLTVDWPAWEEVGMAARAFAPPARRDAETRIALSGHPMLKWRVSGETGVDTFVTRFSVGEHWPLDEHRIVGRAVMPGVAYFDMVRAALADREQGRVVVVREILFREPMHLEDEETLDGWLAVRDEGGGEFSFRVWSIDASSPSGEREHASGRAALEVPAARPRCDLAAIRARCPVEVTIAREDREDDFGPRWQSVHTLWRGQNEVLIGMELPEAFTADWEQWFFHPAVLDRAAGLTKAQLCPEHYYLPWVYQGVAMRRPLRGKVFVHGRRVPELDGNREETITFAFDLFDPEGEALASVERFVQKRVGDPGAQIRGIAARRGEQQAGSTVTAGIRPNEGVEALARLLAARVEPQAIVSPEELHAFLARDERELAERYLAPGPAAGAAPLGVPLEDLSAEGAIEARVGEIWAEVLGVAVVGPADDFFEAGGDSLTAIQLLSRVQEAFGVTLAVDTLFRAPTVAGISALVLEEVLSAVASSGELEAAPRGVVSMRQAVIGGLS